MPARTCLTDIPRRRVGDEGTPKKKGSDDWDTVLSTNVLVFVIMNNLYLFTSGHRCGGSSKYCSLRLLRFVCFFILGILMNIFTPLDLELL